MNSQKIRRKTAWPLALPPAGSRIARLISLCIVVVAIGASASAQNGKIAFSSARNGVQGIWVMNPDGTGAVSLINDVSRNFYDPAWSHDGSKIAFTSGPNTSGDQEISVMNADGTNATVIRNNAFGREPTWSRDGSRIAFAANLDGIVSSIYSVNVDGTGLLRLTDAPPANDRAPAWSPDGSKIAFWSDVGIGPHIAVVNPDGTGRVDLAASQSSCSNTGCSGGLFYVSGVNPAWSPDGTKIAYAGTTPGANLQIYIVNADRFGANPNLTYQHQHG